ncbi:MAG: oligosaccharide flippase family protein [Candidatus Anammoxibacter sp.]
MKTPDIKKLINSRLTRRLTTVFSGNFFGAGLGFLTILIISRQLTVSDFGMFIIVVSLIRIISNISNLGMDTAMTRFVSSYLSAGETGKANQMFRTMFYVRALTSFIIAAMIFGAAELLSTNVFHNPNLIPLFKSAAFGILTVSILNYLKSSLYAYKIFKRSAILQILVDFSKFFTVVIFILSRELDASTAVIIYAFTPIVGVIYGLIQLRRQLFRANKQPIKHLLRQLFSYSKWTFIINVCGTISTNIGIFILAKMMGSEAAGIFGLAHNLTLVFPIALASLRAVLLPEVSGFREISQFKIFLQGSLKSSIYIVIAAIPLLFFSHNIILFFFGPQYIEAVPVFNWLLISYVVITANLTIRVVLLSMDKPHVLAIVSLIRLPVMVIGCYLLIPILGVVTPAILVLILNISVLVFLMIYVYKLVYKGNTVLRDKEIVEPEFEL